MSSGTPSSHLARHGAFPPRTLLARPRHARQRTLWLRNQLSVTQRMHRCRRSLIGSNFRRCETEYPRRDLRGFSSFRPRISPVTRVNSPRLVSHILSHVHGTNSGYDCIRSRQQFRHSNFQARFLPPLEDFDSISRETHRNPLVATSEEKMVEVRPFEKGKSRVLQIPISRCRSSFLLKQNIFVESISTQSLDFLARILAGS